MIKAKAMKTQSFKSLFIVFVLFFSLQSSAQEKTIRGITTIFDSIPLIGATVEVQSTGQTVLSDSTGRFIIECNDKDKLKVSAEGFYKEKVKLTYKIKFAAINMRLKPGEENLDHAIGFGHISEKDRITAVASLNKTHTDFSQFTSMTELIGSRITGVQISNNELVIRGRSTTTQGAGDALILIDGVQSSYTTLKNLPPVMVKNISVIKDASAAIYGARAANGVVLIETKR
jgi:TonB-dependent SusC/RagA subfamily outer membrane receptor